MYNADTSDFVIPNSTVESVVHSYMICGANTDPSKWSKAPAREQENLRHRPRALKRFWRPEILASSPVVDENIELRRTYNLAVMACFPHYFEVVSGTTSPPSTHHTFVLQRFQKSTLFGVVLCVWTPVSRQKSALFNTMWRNLVDEGDSAETDGGTANTKHKVEEQFWLPSALCFLCRLPLFDLLGDYIREMWLYLNTLKDVRQAHSSEILRVLRLQLPSVGGDIRLELKNYIFSYRFPMSYKNFRNFELWPLFACLSLNSIVTLIEAALSPKGRIIFISHHISMLTIAAETIRYFVRTTNWEGLYVPVAHAHHAEELVMDSGPYILGFTAETQDMFSTSGEVYIVDLDCGRIMAGPKMPNVLTTSQRNKLTNSLAHILGGWDQRSGVPDHLQYAHHEENGKVVFFGTVSGKRDPAKIVPDPTWWHGDEVIEVFDQFCRRYMRKSVVKAFITGTTSKQSRTTVVKVTHINELVRSRNASHRETYDTLQDYEDSKKVCEREVKVISTKCNYLIDEIDNWKVQFERCQEITNILVKQGRELKEKILVHEKQNDDLSSELRKGKERIERLTNELTGTERQRDEALSTILQQQIITEELDKRRKVSLKDLEKLKEDNEALSQQRQVIEHQMQALQRERKKNDDDDDDDRTHLVGSENLNTALTRSKETDKSDWTRNYSSKPSASYEQHLAEQNIDRRKTVRISSTYLLSRPKSFDSLNMYTTKLREPNRQITERRSSIFTKAKRSEPKVESPIEDKISAIGDIIRRITEQSVSATGSPSSKTSGPSDTTLSSAHPSTPNSPSSLSTERAGKPKHRNSPLRDGGRDKEKADEVVGFKGKDSPTLTPELSLSHRTSVDSEMSALTTISSKPTAASSSVPVSTTIWSASPATAEGGMGKVTNLDDAWGFLKDVYANLDLAEQREEERARDRVV